MRQSSNRSNKTSLEFKEIDFPFQNFFLKEMPFFCTSSLYQSSRGFCSEMESLALLGCALIIFLLHHQRQLAMVAFSPVLLPSFGLAQTHYLWLWSLKSLYLSQTLNVSFKRRVLTQAW